jgi:hypothetical protein
MRKEFKRKYAIALGVCVICLLFLMETAVAYQWRPDPASPCVRTVPGLAGGIALAFSIYYRLTANAAPE